MNYTIKTLTPVHVGSGNDLLADFDFINLDGKVVILDERKILQHIGEANMHQWLNTLDQGTGMYQLLSSGGKVPTADGVGKRALTCNANKMPTTGEGRNVTVKEQISTLQRPYFPGSSIKGAVRTALFTHFVIEDDNDFYDEKDDRDNNINLINYKKQYDDSKINKRHFGNDPNHDILRLIQVGDVMFEYTECELAKSINLTNKGWEFKDRIQQYIECVPQGQTSQIRFNFNEKLAKNALKTTLTKKVRRNGRNEWIDYLLFDEDKIEKVKNVFSIINQHTLQVLEHELEFWEDDSYPNTVADYIEKLRDIATSVRELVNSKSNDACILRMAWGTGHKNITGDWQADKLLQEDYEQLVATLRKKIPAYKPFPKTRRMLHDGTPLGFVRISK